MSVARQKVVSILGAGATLAYLPNLSTEALCGQLFNRQAWAILLREFGQIRAAEALDHPGASGDDARRSNIALDRRLPGGITGTAEFMYNRDVNSIYYINANLPAPQTAFVGADTRPRWTSNRINNVTGNQVTAAIVMKNQDIGRNWNIAFSATKPM